MRITRRRGWCAMTLPVVQQRPTRFVPCGSCNECCRNDAIFMHPECGDDPATYETEPYEGRVILKHKDNGDCIYLDRATGCTIHERRPVVCRELDCRELVNLFGAKRLKEMGMGAIEYAARRLNKRIHTGGAT